MKEKNQPSYSHEIRLVDRELLSVLRKQDSMSTVEMIEMLGVTATAVRQRVDRLFDAGYIEREKVVLGRGRPSFRYHLSDLGRQQAGANPSLLANAMWEEILEIKDTVLRDSVIAGIASRLGRQYAKQLDESLEDLREGEQDGHLTERLKRLVEIFLSQEIESSVCQCKNGLPVLGIHSCPYPSIAGDLTNRSMCRLEEVMISTALGYDVHLSSCTLDGDQCCHFSPTDNKAGSSKTESSEPLNI